MHAEVDDLVHVDAQVVEVGAHEPHERLDRGAALDARVRVAVVARVVGVVEAAFDHRRQDSCSFPR
jgi:hypothetical protein